ncbi:Rha family transcriptional regulator [Alkanindiges illinoisensis]|uniref:Rha family transcriptional regulator n=1 Tax=Alkanindiges illinoisensis TaxID=197183 RepID=A0A4Y7X9I6_9GAMM|nr:Rha family transcriptional regulator [Alkanindiges illinoisensis]TEU23332.1 Rha family transcriptional regulator [Alkanindiges illinoisensis]
MNTPIELNQAVFIDKQEIKTDSLKVAEAFGKLHKNVIRDIESLNCSSEFNQLNFERVDYVDGKGEKRPMYEMTKDGFIFLVMGFTGAKAAQIKEAYIKVFNQMAERLQQQLTVTPFIQVGSLVQLRSGSPDFTVQHIDGQLATVIWFGRGKLQKEILPLSCLVLSEAGFAGLTHNQQLETFWTAVMAYGIHHLNHSNRADQIALNITQVTDTLPQTGKHQDLLQLLPHSKPPYPQYLERNIVVASRLERKSCRCWIFRSTTPLLDVSGQHKVVAP